MQTKWWLLLVGIIVVVVSVIGVGSYFFLFGSFEGVPVEPPVDISGIHLSSDLLPQYDLIPSQITNIPFDEETVYAGTMSGSSIGTSGFSEYRAHYRGAYYDGINIEILKADSEQEATVILEMKYDDGEFFENSSGTKQKFKTPLWFTYEASEVSGFYWKSGIWIFKVEAGNAEIRNQAAEELVQALRGY